MCLVIAKHKGVYFIIHIIILRNGETFERLSSILHSLKLDWTIDTKSKKFSMKDGQFFSRYFDQYLGNE